MKKFKKATSKLAMGLTAAAMALSGTAMSAMPTFAYDYVPIALDTEVRISAPDREEHYFSFTPEETGDYRFYSFDADTADPEAAIYADVAWDDCLNAGDDEDGCNFVTTTHFEANTTYYFVVGTYESGNFSVRVEKVEFDDSDDDPDDDSDFYSFTPITVDQGVTVGEETSYFSFSPDKTGEYRIYSYNRDESATPCVYVYTDRYLEDFMCLGEDENLSDFEVYEYFEAGETYYLRAYNIDTGEFSFMIEEADVPGDENDTKTVSIPVICKDAEGTVIWQDFLTVFLDEDVWVNAPYMDGYAARIGGQVVYAVTEDTSVEFVYDKEGTKVNNISLDKTSLSVNVKASATLKASVSPADAENKNVTWSSSNNSVATVKDGKVTALKPGSATITATTEDGSRKASCTVTVKALDISGASVSGLKASYNYTGKNLTPAVTVKNGIYDTGQKHGLHGRIYSE